MVLVIKAELLPYLLNIRNTEVREWQKTEAERKRVEDAKKAQEVASLAASLPPPSESTAGAPAGAPVVPEVREPETPTEAQAPSQEEEDHNIGFITTPAAQTSITSTEEVWQQGQCSVGHALWSVE